MNRWIFSFALVLVIGASNGCTIRQQGKHESADQEDAKVELYQKNKGLALPEDVRQCLELELAAVEEREIARFWTRAGRVFRPQNATANAQASVVLTSDESRLLAEGWRTEIKADQDVQPIPATLLRVERQLERALGQVEAIIEFTDAEGRHPLGASATVSFKDTRSRQAMVVPENAVIQGGEGDFVYVENGRHLSRTAVKTGARSLGWVEIVDGLLEGDKVAVKGSKELWMIELMALRGGTPCCPVPQKQPGK